MPKYKATAYIRLSYTDDHSSESDSVSNQRKLIENFVERNPDIEVVSEKIDDGYSGIIFDRPAFKEMMNTLTTRRSTKAALPTSPWKWSSWRMACERWMLKQSSTGRWNRTPHKSRPTVR